MKRNTPMHPKTVMLASMLGLKRYQAVGLLEMLWHFTAQYCPCGDVGKRTDAQIASFLDWPIDQASNLINAFVECNWLDRHPEFRLIVHDWHEHADGTCDKYLSDKSLQYATGHDPRRKKGQSDKQSHDKSRQGATSNDSRARARSPESESESESESDSLDARAGDDVHLFLVKHEALRAMTYEQDLRARMKAGYEIHDPRLMDLARRAANDAVIMGELDHPAAFWAKFLEKNKGPAAERDVPMGGENAV